MKKQIFLSYGSPDKPFVRKLAADLKKIGVSVWFDEWEIRVGDSITGAINQAIEKSSFFGAVISDDSVKRPWVQKELKTAMYLQVEGKLKILPVLLAGISDIPPFIKELRYADFSGSYQFGLRDLVLAIDPSKASQITILHSDTNVAEKITWFAEEFSLNYLKTHSNQKMRQYSSSSEDNQRLYDQIVQEINSEWEHLCTTTSYSKRGIGSPKSGVAYLRDNLLESAIDPFKDIYDPVLDDPAYFKKMFIDGNQQFENFLFENAKESYMGIINTHPDFEFANEKFKLFVLDRIIAYFERFCLFEPTN